MCFKAVLGRHARGRQWYRYGELCNSVSGITVNLNTLSTSGGDAAGDILSSIENVIGSALSDIITGNNNGNVLTGGDGDDVIIGSGGDDTLVGGEGADSLIGGGGVDTVSYTSSAAGVTVNLATTEGIGGDAEGDTLSGIEIIRGSNFVDILTGDGLANTLSGGGGNDIINGGDGNDVISGGNNADSLNGGAGVDTLDAAGTGADQIINITTNTITGGDSTGDTIANFENVTGGSGNDVIIGSAVANILNGGNGNDTINGGAGADTLIGGAGTDVALYETSVCRRHSQPL